MKKGFYILLAFVLMVVLAVTHTNAYARIKAQPEYKIKAAYLYNFLLFAEWPEHNEQETSEKTITIGIIGKDPFGDSFDEVEGRFIKSKKKKLIIKRFGPYKKGLNLKQCHILFIASSERNNCEELLVAVEGSPVLTVSDFDGFLESGGMINLVKFRRKIRWEINQTPVKKAKLRLSSQILRNAVRVVRFPKDSTKNPTTGSSSTEFERE